VVSREWEETMSKMLIAQVLIAIALMCGFAAGSKSTQPRRSAQGRKTCSADIQRPDEAVPARSGSTIDDSKSTVDMVVSNYPDAKGGKVTIVLVNDRRRNLLGFTFTTLGVSKSSANKEASTSTAGGQRLDNNGSFFVDNDDDIGYKYLVSSGAGDEPGAFDYAYFTMAAVARERKPQIKKLLGPANEADGEASGG
jgi:hypothetical protein